MKKCIVLCMILCMIFLTACGSGETKYFKNHPAKELLEGDNPDAKCRYSSITEGTYYCSYSVYRDLSEEQLEQIAEYIYLEISGKSFRDGGKGAGINSGVGNYSFAFYKDDKDKLIDEFMYQDGKRQPSSDQDVFIPGDLFDSIFNNSK